VERALVTERRKLTFVVDLGISKDGDGPTVGERVLPKRERDVLLAGLAEEVRALVTKRGTTTGGELERSAKGSTSSSGNGSGASRMTSWQRLPPSLHLSATGEPSRLPLMVGHAFDALISPLSVVIVLSEDSEDGEQSNDGGVGLRGDALNVSDTERRRDGGETSSREPCGGAGRVRVGAGTLGLGGNPGDCSGCESSG